MDSLKLTQIAVEAADDKHANNIKVLDIQEMSIVADYFVIMDASSSRQVEAIVNEIEDQVEANGGQIGHKEGNKNSSWILLDIGDVIIHVFLNEEREFYNLEKLWSDAKEVDITKWTKA
ncbi:ribosomal silencing factor RsfS [Companilactobacillus sp. RD055328]|uniref:ribosome silencing factor n=1 Tax=Companilactobacillus sp. RD055328 TaxID=2916634 RepID=UPI001FC7FCB3|nr:ribosome silencing factor [Companilactobacillus sp. RD055328]GKQ42515.1 ribosomal silencing factor RsfS [Companilactobacillus sp. RD055328]